ncbi:MAG: acyl carrier protein [Cytophagales bacterium]|nr:acyl carrier protein [Cytophagales bacterium]
MEFDQVLRRVNEIFIDELENEDIVLSYETSAKDIEEWDSLNHIALVVAIEKSFKIRFKSGEINEFKNVGEMCDAILLKI